MLEFIQKSPTLLRALNTALDLVENAYKHKIQPIRRNRTMIERYSSIDFFTEANIKVIELCGVA